MAIIPFYALGFLLHQILVTIAAPANAISSALTLSLTQLNASMTERKNFTSSVFLSTSARIGLLQARPQRFVFRIPGTATVLDVHYFHIPSEDGNAMVYALDTAYTAIANHINAHGDGPMLPPDFDPYETPRIPEFNCTITASSTVYGQLTFRIMMDVLRFLYEYLYDGERFGIAVVGVADLDIRPDMAELGVVSIGPYED